MPTPPRRQQPERGHELGEPEGPVRRHRGAVLLSGDHRVYDEQTHEAEEYVWAQPDLGVYGQCTRIASGRAPCASPLPMWDGMCRRTPGM